MRLTGTLHRDHVVASIIVVLVHLLLAWALSRLLEGAVVSDARDDGDDSHATRIAFIDRPIRAGGPVPSAAGAPLKPSRERITAAPAQPAPPVIASDATAEAAPMSAVLLGQAQRWAEQKANSETTPGNAFERVNPLSDELRPSRGHFRFREPTSVASVVVVIGKVFSPPGYEADPCLQNRRNIAELATAGDSPALQQDVDFERRYCRP
jgi:hypothetical protein